MKRTASTSSQKFKNTKLFADQDNAVAQNNLGVIYDNGEGVLKNSKEAERWNLKLAEQGYASAQYNLALRYCNGSGVSKDLKKCA